MSDTDWESVTSAVGSSAAAMMEVMELAEVQEALDVWANGTWELIRALERAGIASCMIASFIAGGSAELVVTAAIEDAEES